MSMMISWVVSHSERDTGDVCVTSLMGAWERAGVSGILSLSL